jgi:hypothetical protein
MSDVTALRDGLSKAAIDSLFADGCRIEPLDVQITEKSTGVLLAKARAGAERFRQDLAEMERSRAHSFFGRLFGSASDRCTCECPVHRK